MLISRRQSFPASGFQSKIAFRPSEVSLNHGAEFQMKAPLAAERQSCQRLPALFAYANNNPLYYTDPDGHFAIPVAIIAVAIFAMKAIDYGWTAYDVVQAGREYYSPGASAAQKQAAAESASMAITFELLEPDDLSPIALPIDDIVRHGDDISEGLIRLVRGDQVGTSQPFKLRKGEDGLSVFEGVSPEEVLDGFPGIEVPNTTITIPKDLLPPGTQIIPKLDPSLSQRLSEAHRILVRPEGWSVDRFAKTLKALVGWE
jgi:hypothetical protein